MLIHIQRTHNCVFSVVVEWVVVRGHTPFHFSYSDSSPSSKLHLMFTSHSSVVLLRPKQPERLLSAQSWEVNHDNIFAESNSHLMLVVVVVGGFRNCKDLVR